MKYGLCNGDIEKILTVFREFPQIEKAILYGSRAKGNYKKGSDIDITLIGNDLNLSVLNSIGVQIDDLLLPYLFDFSIFNQITNASLIEHIDRVGIEFYNKSKNC